MSGSLELPLAFHGHMATLRVALMEKGGWDVHASVDGRQVAHVHCTDWNRVERFRSQVRSATPASRRSRIGRVSLPRDRGKNGSRTRQTRIFGRVTYSLWVDCHPDVSDSPQPRAISSRAASRNRTISCQPCARG